MTYTPDPFKGFIPRQNPPKKRVITYQAIRVRYEDLPAHIPPHDEYRCAVERWVYLIGNDMVAGQGIVFDGVDAECFLVLSKVNGGVRWLWSARQPAHDRRELVWSITH